MNKETLVIYIIFLVVLVVLVVARAIIIVKEREKKYKEIKQFIEYEDELEKYKINDLKEKVNKYKPPYEVGQRVIYNDRTYARIGCISGIKTEHKPDNESKELVITHAYEIEGEFYTDIIDVVKEEK